MSCICQYIINSPSSLNNAEELASFATEHEVPPETTASKEAVTDDTKISVCVSELVDCRAENWLLKKKLHEYAVTIENLEQLMTTIVNKQHNILSEMFQLRKRNLELQTECHLQREYHTMERNALMNELHDAKTLARDHLLVLQSGEEGVLNQNQDYEVNTESESDEDCGSDDDDPSEAPSFESSVPSSLNSSAFSTDSEIGDTETEDEGLESQIEEYSTQTDTESD